MRRTRTKILSSEKELETEINSPFDKALPVKPIKISANQNRITYQRKSAGKRHVIALKQRNKYTETIFAACTFCMESSWFEELLESSQFSYLDILRDFFNWINASDCLPSEKTRFNILLDYQTYYHNDRSLKRSPISSIKHILEESLTCGRFSDEKCNYILTLVAVTKTSRQPESVSITLSSWFEIPWVRQIIGDKKYLSLESPRRLFNSFRITTAYTLIWLLEQRKEWRKRGSINIDSTTPRWHYQWATEVFRKMVLIDGDGKPENDLDRLVFLDLVKDRAIETLQSELADYGTSKIKKKIRFGGYRSPPWKKPFFIHPCYQNSYSSLEEILCSWLLACECVQPKDIAKLKSTDFAWERTRSGRPIAMECTYYKGRSGYYRASRVIPGKDPTAKAIDSYLLGLTSNELFNSSFSDTLHFSISTVHSTQTSRHTLVDLLLNIWRQGSFKSKLDAELLKAGASDIFVSAMTALAQGESKKQIHKSVADYRESVSRPLPLSLFTLTHIKNTAVHADSDRYRDSDLVNNHSHTSATEKLSYMTDSNKEWVNQAGRITRLVLNDLQNIVFQPPLQPIITKLEDLESRTEIIEKNSTKKPFLETVQDLSKIYQDDIQILVPDTNDSALFFIHYLSEAEKNLSSLTSLRPDWVEQTLIVNLEWMTRTLTKMKSASSARALYRKVSPHLPSCFDHLLGTTE